MSLGVEQVPQGRLNGRPVNRPFGAWPTHSVAPTLETPGYCRQVPSGQPALVSVAVNLV